MCTYRNGADWREEKHMASGIYVSMGAARNQEHRMETLANDLANANTPGFKSQEAIYKQIHNFFILYELHFYGQMHFSVDFLVFILTKND